MVSVTGQMNATDPFRSVLTVFGLFASANDAQ